MVEIEELKAKRDINGLISCLSRLPTTLDAEDALVEIGEPAVEPMADALKELRRGCDPSVWELRGDCHAAIELIRGLGRIRDRRAVPAIVWWDPIPETSPQGRRALVKDRRLYLKDPAMYDEDGYWRTPKQLTAVWVDALMSVGGPEAEKALGGPWGLP